MFGGEESNALFRDVEIYSLCSSIGYNDTFFDFLPKYTELEADLALYMRGTSESTKIWVSILPTESLLVGDDSGSYDQKVVVDMGGGTGHDIKVFQRKLGLGHGRLVLQDPDKKAMVESNMILIPQDFFQIRVVRDGLHVQPWDRLRSSNVLRTTC